MSGVLRAELIRRWLAWARNYEEVIDFKLLPKVDRSGRRWLVRVRPGIEMNEFAPLLVGAKPVDELVPEEMVFTPREAIAFAMGCAVGGSSERRRQDWSQVDWGAQAAKRKEQRA